MEGSAIGVEEQMGEVQDAWRTRAYMYVLATSRGRLDTYMSHGHASPLLSIIGDEVRGDLAGHHRIRPVAGFIKAYE